MSTHEPNSMHGDEGDQLSKSGLGLNQEEFEQRLNRAETRSFWRTAVSIAVLIAAGLSILGYSVQRARQEAENALSQAHDSRLQTLHFQAQLHELEQSLSNSREAVQYVTQGINLYHAGSYAGAVKAYDAALQLDPSNAYTLDLKGYSLFKLRDYAGAILALQSSVTLQPDYAWGYFDLARVYCADAKYDLASPNIESALKIRPDLASSMKNDGEFLRLCAPLRKTFAAGSVASSATAAQPFSGGSDGATESSIRSTIDEISKRQHGTLPQPAQTEVGVGQQPHWTVKNETPYPLNVYIAGPVARMYPISKGQSVNDELPVGNYRLAVSSPTENITPLYTEMGLDAHHSSVLTIRMKTE